MIRDFINPATPAALESREDEDALRQEKLAEVARRKDRAERIINDELVVDAIKSLRSEIFADFTRADPSDAELLKTVRLRFQILADFEAKFVRHIKTGQLAADEMSRLAKIVNKVRRGR